MTKEWLLDTVRAILAGERDAIKRLDAAAMERTSNAKEAVLAELHVVPYEERGPFIEALAELQPELSQNMKLLAQEAAYIAEARRARRAAVPLQRAS